MRQHRYRVDGEEVALNDTSSFRKRTFFYARSPTLVGLESPSGAEAAVVVQNADCIEVAQALALTGLYPAVLNMANRQTPGGGVVGGAGAQEENLFRRSDLFASLFPFADFCQEYGLARDERHSYPLGRESGGIYSSQATFFRASEPNGYRLLKHPFRLSVVSVPAINTPDLVVAFGGMRITERLVEPTREKIRTILRIASHHRHDSLVLSAFGCGAFGNPPGHMAELFAEVFNESEFAARFRLIVFAIVDDHNARKTHNPEGNVIPFLRVFD